MHSLNGGRLQPKSSRNQQPRKRLPKPVERKELKDRTFEPLAPGELEIFTRAIARQATRGVSLWLKRRVSV